MQWADVTATPSTRKLRQFAGLWLLFFLTLATWRAVRPRPGVEIGAAVGADLVVLAALGLVIGVLGLVRPGAIRLVYTGWMIAAFPLGWTISRAMLAALFYGLFTPVALVFRLVGRDSLRLRRRDRPSYWTPKAGVSDVGDYFRQF